MFNIVQAYTKAAQYPSLPAESAFKLQKLGGRILSMVKTGEATLSLSDADKKNDRQCSRYGRRLQ